MSTQISEWKLRIAIMNGIAEGLNQPRIQRVSIPANGTIISVRLEWQCPTCGRRRGKPTLHQFSSEPSLAIHHWINPCGHQDWWPAVLREARANGLNP